MKKIILFTVACMAIATGRSQLPVQLQPLHTGTVQPAGWIHQQMKNDLEGFAGHLDALVPELFADDIYGKDRLGKESRIKNLGNSKEGDAGGDEQYQWWNSETQSNWWDGYIRSVFMLDDSAGIQKATAYIRQILATQDADGYLGIYDAGMRYRFSSENGELWSKTTLYRGLLAYYELTGDEAVLNAVKRAVANVMLHYPADHSSPFSSGTGYNGGVSHGLAFTDILYKLFLYTGAYNYLDYALFLYRDYSQTTQSEKDAQSIHIRDTAYRMQSHAVHSYEHIRSLVTASLSKSGDDVKQLLPVYLSRVHKLVTVTGGAIGDEWIGGQTAHETHTGYEYCSLHELLDSYALLLQVTGDAAYGDAIEKIFYNAAQGSRHPYKSAIAYLKTDNSYVMDGTKNGVAEKDRKQTRYKYSPAHQDVAVCCSPNAGRITPCFIQNSWLKKDDSTLVFALPAPTTLHTSIQGIPVSIEVKTDYPYAHHFSFIITAAQPVKINLVVRRPGWVTNVNSDAGFSEQSGWLHFPVNLRNQKTIQAEFDASVQKGTTASGERYFSYGALVYALPLQAEEKKGKNYGRGLTDLLYVPKQQKTYQFSEKEQVSYRNQTLITMLYPSGTHKKEKVTLVPMAKTILRQVSFPTR